ncbi:MAG: PEP-CTERM sorting domain-containing protein [Planctomycetia bacterium]|jgi:hypothetical protein
MKKFVLFTFCGAIAIAILGLASTPSFGGVIYGPVTNETGDQGNIVTFGPENGSIADTYPGNVGEMVLNLDPDVNGSGVVNDTASAIILSTYTATVDMMWDGSTASSDRFGLFGYSVPGVGAIGFYNYRTQSYVNAVMDLTNPKALGTGRVEDWSNSGDRITSFTGATQASGDGTSGLDEGAWHTVTMDIVDTGDNATSTFAYTWEQNGNTWVAEKTFAQMRADAVAKGGVDYGTHVGDLFDTLVSAARSDTTSTNVAYYTFSGSGSLTLDNTTVTAVPEPSTIILLASLLLGLLIWRKK